MQLKFLKMKKNAILSFVVILFLISCVGNTPKNESATSLLTPVDKYSSYVVDSVFDSEQFLKDMSGTWVCYKYAKDTVTPKSHMFYFDESMAFELSRYYYFTIDKDEFTANDIFSISIDSYDLEVDSFHWRLFDTFNNFRTDIGLKDTLKYVYNIEPVDSYTYREYLHNLMEKGDTLPYYNSDYYPKISSIWCFPEVLVFCFNGYNYYFKKGDPNNEGIIGIPSDRNNRFIVNRVYKSCTIEESAYKLIEDFPSITEGLMDRDRETGESYFWNSSGEFNATIYDWKNEDEVIVRAIQSRNCTFVFEFNQVGDDVHIKYWNDVVFPFEEGYQGH